MEVREENEVVSQPVVLRCDRLLDLQQELGVGPDVVDRGDLSPDRLVRRIGKRASVATSLSAGRLPDRIAIYRLPLEDEFGHDPETLEREIRITVLHELGHYFGIDEDRIAELGYE